MDRDTGDIIDRYTIAWLKKDRIGTEDNQKEYDAFRHEVFLLVTKHPNHDWDQIVQFMYDINDFIWQLEAGLKSGQERLNNPHYILDEHNRDSLSKIGVTAILNRNFNNLRVRFKNLVNKMVKEGWQDVKKDHV